MVLEYLGIRIRYGRLKRLLKVQDLVGASFYNLRYLEVLNTSVTIRAMDGNMEILHEYLANSHPVIAAIHTADLPYWATEPQFVDHAIVVSGIDEVAVAVHDPWFIEAPKVVEKTQFESAWLYREYSMAVIEKS